MCNLKLEAGGLKLELETNLDVKREKLKYLSH